jgi:DNA-binding transcriptional ArsR family regulator
MAKDAYGTTAHMKHILNTSDQSWETMLGVLADRSRLLIINELLKSESSVNDLANALSNRPYNISKHLKILEESGLVVKRKNGIKRIYKISEDFQPHSSDAGRVLDLGCCMFLFNS